jgi:hypothetical protein
MLPIFNVKSVLACALVFVAFGARTAIAQPTYTIFAPSGATQTYAVSINDSGAITGAYVKGGESIGFLRAADGTFTSFTAQGNCGNTYPQSINNLGIIAGNHCINGKPPMINAFLRDAGGTIMSFRYPDTVYTAISGTNSLNGAGAITGSYRMTNISQTHGFVRAPNGGLATFDPSGSIGTGPCCINGAGVVSGEYTDGSNVQHGFVRAANGTFTSFDPPGSTKTTPQGINGVGVITGNYVDSTKVQHGFVRAANGTITSFDPAGSTATSPNSINGLGSITGAYTDSKGAVHGFVRRPSDGAISSFDPAGSIITVPLSINNKSAITGYYHSKSLRNWGFLRTP